MGGMVLETNMTEILTRIEEQNKLEKQEVKLNLIKYNYHYFILLYQNIVQAGIAGAPSRAVSAMKNMNIPQQLKDMKLPDLPQAIKELKF